MRKNNPIVLHHTTLVLNPEEELTLFLYSFRYALGRSTYAVGEVADLIKGNWSKLNYRTRLLILRDLREAIADDDRHRERWLERGDSEVPKHFRLGMDMDRDIWVALQDWISEENKNGK